MFEYHHPKEHCLRHSSGPSSPAWLCATVQRLPYLIILFHQPPDPWRHQVYSITLTFNWTLTNAQTPTQNLPLLRSTKSRSGKENQQKETLIPMPYPFSSCWQPNISTLHPHPENIQIRNQTMPSKVNEEVTMARKHTHPHSAV